MDTNDAAGDATPFVPAGYVPYAEVSHGRSPHPVNARLIAAGVMSIIEGAACAVIAGLGVVLVVRDEGGDIIDMRQFGLVLVVLFGLLAAAFLVGGIASVRGLRWGRVMVIVIFGLLTVLLGIATLNSEADIELAPVAFTAWHVIVLVLAVSGRRPASTA